MRRGLRRVRRPDRGRAYAYVAGPIKRPTHRRLPPPCPGRLAACPTRRWPPPSPPAAGVAPLLRQLLPPPPPGAPLPVCATLGRPPSCARSRRSRRVTKKAGLTRCHTPLSLWLQTDSPACGLAHPRQAPPPGTPSAPESPGLKDGQGTAVITGIVSLILGVRRDNAVCPVCLLTRTPPLTTHTCPALPVRVPGAGRSPGRPGPAAAAARGARPVRLRRRVETS